MTRISSRDGRGGHQKKHPVNGAEVPDRIEDEEGRTLYRKPQRGMDGGRHGHARPHAWLKI